MSGLGGEVPPQLRHPMSCPAHHAMHICNITSYKQRTLLNHPTLKFHAGVAIVIS